MTDIVVMELFILLIPYLIGYSLVLIALGAYLMTQNVLLTFVALFAIPLNLVPVFRMRKPLWGFSWMSLQRRAEVTTVIDETVRGARVVKAFNRGPEERRKLAGVAANAYGVAMSRARFFARYEFFLKAIPAALQAAILFFAARLIVTHAITLGIFLVFLRYSRGFNDFANSMSDFANIWQNAKAATGRIVDLISLVHTRTPVEAESPLHQPMPEPTTGLRMTGVGFAYADTTVLDGFDVSVAPGQLVVVTGGPRSGKSTVATLAVGGLSPSVGSIALDGVRLDALDPAEVRREVRVLTEEPFLFGRSVRENLEMGAGRTGVPDEPLNAALWAAGADEIIAELEGGLDEVLGDRGLTLSGGQRQRLALARALVVPPRVLVLDDALLAVNPSLEVDILRRIRSHAPQMAILCLTRRTGPAALADTVVPLHPATAATGGEPEAADLVAGRDVPIDTQLLDAISQLPSDTDTPPVGDADCEQSDVEPGVRSMLGPLKWPVIGVSALVLVATVMLLVPDGVLQSAIDHVQKGDYSFAQVLALVGLVFGVGAAAVNWIVRVRKTRPRGRHVHAAPAHAPPVDAPRHRLLRP